MNAERPEEAINEEAIEEESSEAEPELLEVMEEPEVAAGDAEAGGT
jgi:hypothetical protein